MFETRVQVSALRREKSDMAARVAKVEAERERVVTETSRKMKELTRGVLMYKCLGLEFEVGFGCHFRRRSRCTPRS